MGRRKTTTFATVQRLALTLPGVEAATSWGAPAFKVGGKMFACAAIHRSAEPDTLVVRMDFDERDELIAADPETYYLKEHYVNYACVLVRLKRVHPDCAICSRWDGATLRRADDRRGEPGRAELLELSSS
jgi:hypothetical protein